ncbi:MAG: YlxM family DNA-binding protein [Dethiobacteria bacterium]|jgi:predicted DNA-binding protein YlxM (UPF0122 family)
MLEKVNRLNYLFDFYGTLLTEKQQRVIEMYYKDDFSLAEVAGHLNISRQAVHDILSRTVLALENWEKKLNLYASYLQRKEDGHRVLELLARRPLQEEDIDAIKEIVRRNMVEN